ncbi:fumarylacetoacetase [Acidisphaera sp. S103]|uniref:fumarylacetoacetase n=1 Tax=Acidisphaera sp. S103 TaxID=1747223 RepID=UPI00131C9700|nr:fumarylacetoacetase [Acidisphaera sp. S103]
MIDETHAADRTSWIASANGHATFPIQNLPLGVFSPQGGAARGGIAIGESIFDIGAALEADLFSGAAREAAEAASGRTLNPLLEAGPAARQALRRRVGEILDAKGAGIAKIRAISRLVHDASGCVMQLPAAIGDFTDFFAGIHHAHTAGMINRPDNPLMPNYKYVPVAYHSRASSVRTGGGLVRRPNGQRKLPEQDAPDFGPCRNLDYELELGVWIGPGNELGSPIPIAEASRHIAGFCLLNDWSARDIQAWESQPLGPFLSKSLSTFVSPWIVTSEALAPFRMAQPPRPAGDPAPLPHLNDVADQARGCFGIDFQVLLLTPRMRAAGAAPHVLSRANASMLYWTAAQMVAHHTSNGCDLRPGDLFGSGTVSGTVPGSEGCLLEMTRGGRNPVSLPGGETRTYLMDGDEVIFRGTARRDGYASIGFGECRGTIGEALALG